MKTGFFPLDAERNRPAISAIGQQRRPRSIRRRLLLAFRNRMSVEADHTEEFKRFEKDFRNRRTGLRVGYNTREYQKGTAAFGRPSDQGHTLFFKVTNVF